MSDITLIVITTVVTGVFFGIVGYSIKLFIDQRSQIALKNTMKQQINMAQERSQELLIEAKERALKIKVESEKELSKQRNNLESLKLDINNKLKVIDKENQKIGEQLKLIKNQKFELKESRELYAKKI